MNLHVVTPLWGDDFIDPFLSAILPNHFSEGNLSALPVGARYRIFTTPEDYDRLHRAIPVAEVVAIKTEGTKFDRMIHCHRVAIEAAKHEQAALIFLAPDHVLSTHALTRLLALRAAGYRAVVSPTPEIRLSRERMLEVLQTQSAFTSRELVRVARTCLHSWSEEHFLDSPRFCKYPSSVYWRVGGGDPYPPFPPLSSAGRSGAVGAAEGDHRRGLPRARGTGSNSDLCRLGLR